MPDLEAVEHYAAESSRTTHGAAECVDAARLLPRIRGSGYVVESLEAALWCFARTRSYPEAVLLAANLGDDADTTAAVTGQIARAFYGMSGIPARWLDRLALREEIEALARGLHEAR